LGQTKAVLHKLSDRDSACQVTGKMKEDITELMNEISDDEENLSS